MEENQEQEAVSNQQTPVQGVVQQPQPTQVPTSSAQNSIDTPTPEKKTRSKKGLIIIVFVTLIIVVVTAVFFFFQSRKPLEQETAEQETDQNIEIESAEGLSPEVKDYYESAGTETTTNWKTYTNSKYGYQFKFPADWIYNRGPGNAGDEALKQQTSIEVHDPSADLPGTNFVLYVNEFSVNGESKECKDLESCTNKAIDAFSSLSPDLLDPADDEILESKAKNLFFTRTTDSYSQSWYHLFIVLDKDFFHFSAYSNTENFEGAKATFDQILSTFEFVE